MSEDAHGERLRALEVRHEELEKNIKRELETVTVSIKGIGEDIGEIKETQDKQRGFWTGVTFIASIIGFALSQVWQFFKPQGS